MRSNSAPQQETAIGQTLQQALQQRLETEALQFRCAVKDQTLLVLAEHLLHVEPDIEQTFPKLERAIRGLVPEMLSAEAALQELPVQMFLRIAGYQQPYASRRFRLELLKPPSRPKLAAPVVIEPEVMPRIEPEVQPEPISPALEPEALETPVAPELPQTPEPEPPEPEPIEPEPIEVESLEPELLLELPQPVPTAEVPEIAPEPFVERQAESQVEAEPSPLAEDLDHLTEVVVETEVEPEVEVDEVRSDIETGLQPDSDSDHDSNLNIEPDEPVSETLSEPLPESAAEPVAVEPAANFRIADPWFEAELEPEAELAAGRDTGETSDLEQPQDIPLLSAPENLAAEQPEISEPEEQSDFSVASSDPIETPLADLPDFDLPDSVPTESVIPETIPESVVPESIVPESIDSLHDVDLLIHQLTDETHGTEPDLLIRELSDFRVPEVEPIQALDSLELDSAELYDSELDDLELDGFEQDSLEFDSIDQDNLDTADALEDYILEDEATDFIEAPEVEAEDIETEYSEIDHLAEIGTETETESEIYYQPTVSAQPELDSIIESNESIEFNEFDESSKYDDEYHLEPDDLEPDDLELDSFESEGFEPDSLELDSETDRLDTAELLAEDSFARAVLSESAVLPSDSLEYDQEYNLEYDDLELQADSLDTAESPESLLETLPLSDPPEEELEDLSEELPAQPEPAILETASIAPTAPASEIPAPEIPAPETPAPNATILPVKWATADKTTESAAEPSTRRSRSPDLVLVGALGMFALVSGLYMLSRPCVIGRCQQIQQAQQLSLAAIQTARTTDSALDVMGAYKQLSEANYLLSTIPAWSSHYPKAQSLLASYEDQSVLLKQVVEALEQANKIAQRSQNPPHPLPVWREIQWSWREVIEGLEQISAENPLYALVQRKLHEYRANLNDINQRVAREQQAQERVAAARKVGELAQSQAEAAQSAENWQETAANWTMAIRQLQQIPQGTVAHAEAQQLLALYQPKVTQANIRRAQEQAAAEAYAQALNSAEQARLLERQNQWPEAAAQWRNALNAAQQVPNSSTYYSQVQPLLGTYVKTLQQAQDNSQRSGAIQLAKASFDQACAGSPKICTYTLSPQAIRVQFTSLYDQTVTQMISNSPSSKGFPPATVNQINDLLRSLADMSEATQVPVELYNSNGSKLGTYEPSASGYALQQ